MSYNKFHALVANVQAIELAMRIRLQGRRATESEKEVLSQYSGFGGIKEVLNIGTNNPVHERMAEPIERLQRLIAEYPYFNEGMRYNVIESIKASVLTAFYTPKFLIDAVAASVQSVFMKNDLPMHSMLEPSAGIGGFLPVAMQRTERYAFEKDYLSGLILSLLNDEAIVEVAGFETIGEKDLEDKTFDVIASNIPFGNIAVYDADFAKQGGIYKRAGKTIHNYFFVKAMELLSEGGLLAFVTSRGVADATGNQFVREYLVNHANLITALRLPDDLFMQTGGIEVGSDLLIFQKNTHKRALSSRERLFTETMQETVDAQGTATEYFNKYFTLPNTSLSTESRIATNQFGKLVRKYMWKNGEEAMTAYLLKLLTHNFDLYFDKGLFSAPQKTQEPIQLSLFDLFGEVQPIQAEPKPNRDKRPYADTLQWWMKEGTMVLFEGQLGTLKFRKADGFSEAEQIFVPLKVRAVDVEKATEYMKVREAYFELYGRESETLTEHSEQREELNRQYDAFVQKWGHFHENGNKEIIMLDASGMEVFTIELVIDGKIVKADIMNEPVAFKRIDKSVVLEAAEALASSLNYYGCVDMDYITQATGKEEGEIAEELDGEIFYNPASGSWEHKGLFLAGNVIAKCKEIRSLVEELTGEEKEREEKAVRALEGVIPEMIPYEELDFNMGERWIPTGIYKDFAEELFGVEAKVMYFDVNDTYVVSLQGYSPIAYNTYSVQNYNGEALFVHALHDTVPEITKTIYRNGERVTIPDEEAIQEASTKIQEIRSKFNAWLDRQPIAVRDELVRLYNERFNCYVRPHYDGSAQTFPSLSFEHFPYNDLYPSQKDAVWMIKQNGGGVCWHEVGAGKTMVMCVAAYEMKRLGMVHKPLIIGLKANVHEIADTFRKAYPSARLLYPGKEDFTPANRAELFNKIRNSNWDCIILTHDQFAKIPQSDETMMDIFTEELQDVERSLEVLERSGLKWRSRRMSKGLEKRQQNLMAKLAELRYNIENARKRIIADMNAGRVRVLFGSTSMLGTGVNAQQRAVAVHHLDIPWRPADLEQRNGRAVRKGNTVKLWGGNKVDVIIYGTEKTLDAYKFSLLRNKQMFISQINSGTVATRRIDEGSMDENNGMNFAEFVAILSGNSDLLDKAKLDNKIGQLEKEQAAFNKERYRAERKMEQSRKDIAQHRQNAGRMTEDWEYFKGYGGDRQMLLSGMPQLTAEETGRELHRISRSYRGETAKTIGSYIGLELTVRSEYTLGGGFDRNTFFVKGKSGLTYRCGISGALPLGFADSAIYPETTLEKLPAMIERQRETADRLESELPTLMQIVAREWGKTEELNALKAERDALQQRIDEALREAERKGEAVEAA